ncbi:Cytochrome bo(3) ubiquinol oxidase subunit 4 [Candidatus Erwinia haradaeae]|uniref:Cytochrome bo(3) ubiquinol oxidase subunit 4 n=1 Tax=Candidatus Erwinia haradaeae TaxID=1922217 RepID=A0A451DL43_9GAMM|nr:cytochrome o ubiquinol oxidase subunit IV [Candidatus Erwinia haradaeae]VFP87459.1 Cytochrome bo(3) ubiquinol oxidase subunit 4 [Candidatus Erwinia haradaeae]
MRYPNTKNGDAYFSLQTYLKGFIFSILLTIIPFWMVINRAGSKSTILSLVIICAIVQIFVHLIYFLHLNRKSEEGWNFIAILFTALIILIIIAGSLWIMWNLNCNMMDS